MLGCISRNNYEVLHVHFMGFAMADDIKDKLLKELEPLPLAKILEVPMDRPSINLKFFRGFQEHLQENYQVHCLN